MKKFITFIALICTISTIALTGCSSFTRQIIEFVDMPDQYYIEYQVIGEDNTVSTVAKGKDAHGNYYYKISGSETLYLYDGEFYTIYKLTEGAWTADIDKVNEKYITEATKGFEEYSHKSMETISGVYTKGENVTLFDRSCDTYTLSLDIVNFTQSYEMIVDTESGVCLSFLGTSSVSSFETDKSGFECTKFEINGLDFSSMIE